MILVRKIQFAFFCLFGLILLTACDSEPGKKYLGIYYWKTSFKLSEEDKSYLAEIGINKLYLRFFDVDWNPEINLPVPVGDVSIETKSVPEIKIVPAIFITNNTFKQIDVDEITELADNVFKKIKTKHKKLDAKLPDEVQMDCDWSESTKEKYFAFLHSLDESLKTEGISLSATIRLHQVKYYKKTGVPPVDKGVLMFYNMSDISDIKTENSIYNERIAKKYLFNFDEYPLELDVVLPAFSWVVHFRNGKVINLISESNFLNLIDSQDIDILSDNTFSINKNLQVDNYYLLKGDLFRIESVSTEDTKNAAEIISGYLNENITVAFYHFNQEFRNNYDKETIKKVAAFFN